MTSDSWWAFGLLMLRPVSKASFLDPSQGHNIIMQDVSLIRSQLEISLLPGFKPPTSSLPSISTRVNISSFAIPQRRRFRTMNTQTLDGRYVDMEKLVKLLKDLFGAGNFLIKVRGSFQESFECSTLTYLFMMYRQLTKILRFPRLGHSLR